MSKKKSKLKKNRPLNSVEREAIKFITAGWGPIHRIPPAQLKDLMLTFVAGNLDCYSRMIEISSKENEDESQIAMDALGDDIQQASLKYTK